MVRTYRWSCWLLVFGLVALYPLTVGAHDVWLEKAEAGYLIAMGHQGQIDPYAPERVRQVTGYTQNNWPVDLAIERGQAGCHVFADEPFCALTAVLDNKYWYKTTDGWKNQREKEGLEIIEQGRSYKYTKHIARWRDFLSRPLGQRIEIVPLKDPTAMKTGDYLPVQVYYEGRLLTAVSLSESSNLSGTHDLKAVRGEKPFAVKIGPPGLQLINAKHRVQVADNQVVWFASSLTFNVSK